MMYIEDMFIKVYFTACVEYRQMVNSYMYDLKVIGCGSWLQFYNWLFCVIFNIDRDWSQVLLHVLGT